MHDFGYRCVPTGKGMALVPALQDVWL